jgi:type IV pilus assembly protein PilO
MELSLSKLPWWGQLGAFVVVSIGAVFGFWYLYVSDAQADIQGRETRLRSMRADIARGVATARQLPEFEAQVIELEHRLDSLRAVLPEEKDVADILRRVQGLATQSNLTIQRFTPQAPRQQNMYAELPFRLTAEGTYHNLGMFFDRVSKFPRIINIGEISVKARQNQEPNVTIVAELVATTFVLQEGQAAAATGRNVVPRQPSMR